MDEKNVNSVRDEEKPGNDDMKAIDNDELARDLERGSRMFGSSKATNVAVRHRPDRRRSAVKWSIIAVIFLGIFAVAIWAIWSATGYATGVFFPPEDQARAASLRIAAIGLLLSVTILMRPRGLMGERATVSRHVS